MSSVFRISRGNSLKTIKDPVLKNLFLRTHRHDIASQKRELFHIIFCNMVLHPDRLLAYNAHASYILILSHNYELYVTNI